MIGVDAHPISATSSNGSMGFAQTTAAPILRQQAEIIEETINLLIFDGKLVEHTRSVQKHLEFQ
jgi:hypothetical protein